MRVRVEQYVQRRRRMEARRGHFLLYPFKRGATGAEVPFHHRCTSRQIFGVRRLCPNVPKLAQLLPTNLLPQRSWRPLFGVTSKKRSLCVFMQTLGAIFLSQTALALFLPGFSGLLPRFSAIQNFWECACNPCTPTSNTTAFRNSSI